MSKTKFSNFNLFKQENITKTLARTDLAKR